MRIRHLFAGLTLLAAMLGVLALGILGSTAQQLDRLGSEQRQASEVARDVSALLTLTHEYILHREPRAEQQWRKRYDSLMNALRDPRIFRSRDIQAQAEVVDSAQALPELFNSLTRTLDAPVTNELTSERRDFLIDRVLAETQAVTEEAFQWEAQLTAAHNQLEDRLILLAITLPASLAVLFAGAAHLLARRILRPIGWLQVDMAAVATGDLSIRSGSAARDELGDLARHFDHMASVLQARSVAVAATETFLRNITDGLPVRIAYVDSELRYRFMNRRHAEQFAQPRERLIGRTIDEIGGQPMGDDMASRAALVLEGLAQHFESTEQSAQGPVHVEVSFVPDIDGQGVVHGFFLSGVDVTERRQQQAQIERALKEKEVLLREIHHRVKNNMQIISSLLQLQTRYLDSDEARAVLAESQGRIRSMALIHEKLYQSRDFAKVDFADYVRALASMQYSFQGELAARVRLEIAVVPVDVEIERAIPAGLILNELLSNSFKHAFPPGRAGRIDVRLQALEDGSVCLGVADDGAGVVPDFDPARSDSLGLRLVHILAEQLGGRLEFRYSRGFQCNLLFGRHSPHARGP